LKNQVANLLAEAFKQWVLDEGLDAQLLNHKVMIEQARDERHGDYASNLAMVVAVKAGRSPRFAAEALIERVAKPSWLESVKIAGPGFINFRLSDQAHHAIIQRIRAQGNQFGCLEPEKGAKKLLIEFVSANPTGPLHVGHGRGAAYGDALARLLRARGWLVDSEYYVNDAGRQMHKLALSVWLRYLERCGMDIEFPSGLYRGDYVRCAAEILYMQQGEHLMRSPPSGVMDGENDEARLDVMMGICREELGETDYQRVFDMGLTYNLNDIREDLLSFGVSFDRWFHESELVRHGDLERAVDRLSEAGWTYEKGGATWFASTRLGDDKDRVLLRENGQPTYFASDVAYHLNKCERGYSACINIWGADHHGYIARVRNAMQALAGSTDFLEILLVQFANLYRGSARVSMSTRDGEFVTLRTLREEVGNDAARFFYVMRPCDQHMDFDLELAKSQSQENPVYYIQYAHARICSLHAQLEQKGWGFESEEGIRSLSLLRESHELSLMRQLRRFEEVMDLAAQNRAPHHLANYLRELASALHTYYNHTIILVPETEVRNARMALVDAVRQVLYNGLAFLGVSAPRFM